MAQGSKLKGVQKKISRLQEKKRKQTKVGAPPKKPKRNTLAAASNSNKKTSAAINRDIERRMLDKVGRAGETTHILKSEQVPKADKKLKFNPKKQFKL